MKKWLALYFILINIFIIVINIPLVIMYVKAPWGTYFPFIHQTEIDYYLYLSAIRESLQGAWTTPALFTSEATRSSLLYSFFIFLGKAAYLFRLSPIAVYHISRFIGTELMLAGIYLISSVYLQKKWVFWGALIGLISTVPPAWLVNRFNITSPSWWSGLDITGRLDFLPHHAFGVACLLFSVYCLLIFLERKLPKYVFFAGILSFLSAITFPPAGLVPVLGIPICIGLYFLKNLKAIPKIMVNYFLLFTLVVLPAVLGLLILRQETLKGFPWSQWKVWDMYMWNTNALTFNRDYYIGSGLLFVFSFIGAVKLWIKDKSFKWLFLSVWAFLPYALLPFTDLMEIGRIRVTFMANFVPMGIIGAYCVCQMMEKIKKVSRRIIAGFIIVAVLLLAWGPVTYGYIKKKYDRMTFGYINIHIPVSYKKAMDYMGSLVNGHPVILGDEHIGAILPAFIPVKSYYGHLTQTEDFLLKQGPIRKFYSGLMNGNEAEDFLSKGNISYVWVDPYEKDIYKGAEVGKYKGLLQKIYDSDGIEIYKVN